MAVFMMHACMHIHTGARELLRDSDPPNRQQGARLEGSKRGTSRLDTRLRTANINQRNRFFLKKNRACNDLFRSAVVWLERMGYLTCSPSPSISL